MYTTDSAQKVGQYKIGQTENHIGAESRVSHQDNSACWEELRVIKYWEVPNCVLDHDVRKAMMSLGHTRGRKEWMICDLDQDTAVLQLDKAIEVATESVLSEEEFRKPTSKEIDKFAEIKSRETGLPYLSRSNMSDNYKKAIGTAISTLETSGLSGGFMVLWPSAHNQLSDSFCNDLVGLKTLKRLGVEVFFMKREDY